ncbi:MAG: flagellar basal body L-ring protein FlgH [Bdellovibrionota bacterium]
MRKILFGIVASICLGLVACAPSQPEIQHPMIPSLAYTSQLKQQLVENGIPSPTSAGFKAGWPEAHITQPLQTVPAHMQYASENEEMRAKLHFVKEMPPEARGNAEVLSNELSPSPFGSDPNVEVHRSQQPNVRDYVRPLTLGNPGVTASLWHESRARNDLFRDFRAYQPMDLVTIIISESSEGTKEADTTSETKSDILAGITNLFGFENDANLANNSATTPFNTSTLVNASSSNSFEGKADTTRKGELKARISAMVVEVLPNGILRIEGEKVIAVNNEEQIIVLSGLVRPRDVNAVNEVDSAKIANMRIDYYGRGTVGEAQFGGWFGRVLRKFWPF